MKTIFYVIATRERINFILRTDVFRIPKARGFRIIIFSPFINESGFQAEFGGTNIIFEALPSHIGFGAHIVNVRNEFLTIQHPRLTYARDLHARATKGYQKNVVPPFAKRFVEALLPKAIFGKPKTWERIERWFSRNRAVYTYFDVYAPSAIIVASAGAEGSDLPFLLEAQRRSVPTYIVDSNIDVFDFRYFSYPRSVTKWMLWNDMQAQDAMTVQKVPAKEIAVTGPGRYDFYFREFQPVSREVFCKSVGLDPKKKIVTYASKVQKMFPGNGDLMTILRRVAETNHAQLYVRFAPGDAPALYADIVQGVAYEEAYNAMDRNHIANLLYHSDVLISIGSTFCLEGILLDRPALWVAFDGFKTLSHEETYGRFYDLEFFKRIVHTNGIPLAFSKEELEALVVGYLKNPALHRQERATLRTQEYGVLDGFAGERIVEEITKNL